MAKAYLSIGAEGAVVIQRDSAEYSADVSVRVSGGVFSRALSTNEIGALAAHCALIYFRRTGKVPLPPCEPPFTSVMFAEREPTPEGEAPQIDTSSCPHCLDECTGECL